MHITYVRATGCGVLMSQDKERGELPPASLERRRGKTEATENHTRFLGSLLEQRVLHEFIIGHEPVREPGCGLYGVLAL
jgi:hypothetical protein